jgi:hypothetical protein
VNQEMIKRSHIAIFVIFSVMAYFLIAWTSGDVADHSVKNSPKSAVVLGKVSSSTGGWSGASPFSVLSCTHKSGEPVSSTACEPQASQSQGLTVNEDSAPLDRARAALAMIEDRSFDKLPMLSSSFMDCWFIHVLALDVSKPHDQQTNTECDFKTIQSYFRKAEDILLKAANQGDYIARQSYIDLLLTKSVVNRIQIDFYDPKSQNTEMKNSLQQLENEKNMAYKQIAAFLSPIRDLSDAQKDLLASANYLLNPN